MFEASLLLHIYPSCVHTWSAHVIGCLRLKKIAQIWWQKNTTITLGNVREVNRFAKKYMCQRMRKKVDRFLQQYYVNGILCFNA